MKQAIRLVLSLGLSALFLWIAFRNVNFQAALGHVGSVSLVMVGLYVVLLAFIQWARAERWKVLVAPFAPLTHAAAFRISNLGSMLVLVLPLRLGEFSRPYLLKKETGARMTAGIGAVVAERAIDGLLVTLAFFLSTFLSGDDQRVPAGLRWAAVLALLFFAGAMGVVIGALLWHDTAVGLIGRVLSRISAKLATRITGMLDAFVDGLRSLPSVRAIGAVVLWTAAYWAANGLGFWFVMRGFGWPLPLTAGFTLVSIIVIAIMIPAGPGFLGTFQGGILAGLAIYGIGANEAAAYGLVVYPLTVLVSVGFGLPYMFSPKARLSEIVHAAPDPS
jgi:uncharacterized protein (TIRG00374 family)